MRRFKYVGPDDLEPENRIPRGDEIRSSEDLSAFIRGNAKDLDEPFTFVIDQDGTLLLAPRRSEHVRAAGGLPVLGAGEIAFDPAARVTFVSNQSVGYQPDESSWSAVRQALQRIGVEPPDGFDVVHIFRTCPTCGQVNIVKDDWFECANCGGHLPR